MRLRIQGDGPSVIKLPGLVGGTGLYAEEVRAAVEAGFRVATLDNAGDRADDPAPGPLGWDRFADEVDAATRRLGEPAVLWGHSFGCLVALAAAARRPERVRGLLLAFPPEPGWRPRLYRALLRRACATSRPDRAAAHLFHLGFYALTAWEFLVPSAMLRLPALTRASRDAATPHVTIRQKLGLLWEDDPGLPAAGLPATVLAAGLDGVATPGRARRLAASIPGCRFRLLRLAGHAGAFSRPRAYARMAIEELRRLAPSGDRAGDGRLSHHRRAGETTR